MAYFGHAHWRNGEKFSRESDVWLRYVYTLRLIGPISYPDECEWFTNKSTVEFSHKCILLPSYVYNMHQDTKSARLIAVCKRSFNLYSVVLFSITVTSELELASLGWEVHLLNTLNSRSCLLCFFKTFCFYRFSNSTRTLKGKMIGLPAKAEYFNHFFWILSALILSNRTRTIVSTWIFSI